MDSAWEHSLLEIYSPLLSSVPVISSTTPPSPVPTAPPPPVISSTPVPSAALAPVSSPESSGSLSDPGLLLDTMAQLDWVSLSMMSWLFLYFMVVMVVRGIRARREQASLWTSIRYASLMCDETTLREYLLWTIAFVTLAT